MELISSVTVRFSRLSPDSKSNLDGFMMPYGCSGSVANKSCDKTPTLLMTSNAMQAAACKHHIAATLDKVIDAVLRDANGEARPGFLRQPRTWKSKSRPMNSIEASGEIVWSNRLDERYDVIVYRATKPHTGVLVVKDGENELARTMVSLSYGAMFGPDVADVDAWAAEAVGIVDETKAPSERLNDAVDEVERERSERVVRLRALDFAGEAYAKALEVFRAPEPAIRWLISPNGALNGKAPEDILTDAAGLKRTKEILDDVVKTLYPLGAV